MSSKAKVLVIDDEVVILKSCDKILSEEGYEVQTVQTGAEGLQKLAREKFDIVLTDLMMPEINGMEVLKRCRETFSDIIVIMITGYTTVQTAVETMKIGAYGYIPKPFTPEELVEAIDRALEKKRHDKGPISP
jgi:DNA-binding NtrC family response regulator